MDIYIYSDESGVFDYLHNDYFVFGGILFFSKEEKDNMERKFIHAENCVRNKENIDKGVELKACNLSNKNKGKLFRSLNNCYKFAVVINQKHVLERIFDNKKSKQRYLDYAFKIELKRWLNHLLDTNIISKDQIDNINVFVDEHTTATNGCYELREGLLNEFKYGTFNYEWDKFFEPIFPNLNDLKVIFCDSKSKPLVRAADIIANRIFYLKTSGTPIKINNNLFVTYLP